MVNYSNLFCERPHKTIRNYCYIISRKDYIKPEIVQCVVLPTSETIVIIKTFWLRLVKRTWKKILHRRKMIMNIKFIANYQINSNFSKKIAGIRGMLSYLKK